MDIIMVIAVLGGGVWGIEHGGQPVDDDAPLGWLNPLIPLGGVALGAGLALAFLTGAYFYFGLAVPLAALAAGLVGIVVSDFMAG